MNRIRTVDNLEDIMCRLKGCSALLHLLYESAGASTISEDAISGVCDLLESICRDFQADIDNANDFNERTVQG